MPLPAQMQNCSTRGMCHDALLLSVARTAKPAAETEVTPAVSFTEAHV
eukprot:CAMPEP_0119348236 /NCGR_PEP_ID=MMETSP1333-20130426/108941_1 /TAXON_ID=418940 /ORGANISM="Scyphosphaera apsteinii, Strain RCC1455" /LENGTH=47 /DNA_ID= /DNA_START= /DNA_END= /DNA_ORIENTATION=